MGVAKGMVIPESSGIISAILNTWHYHSICNIPN